MEVERLAQVAVGTSVHIGVTRGRPQVIVAIVGISVDVSGDGGAAGRRAAYLLIESEAEVACQLVNPGRVKRWWWSAASLYRMLPTTT